MIDLLNFAISDPIRNNENFTFILSSQNKESESHILVKKKIKIYKNL